MVITCYNKDNMRKMVSNNLDLMNLSLNEILRYINACKEIIKSQEKEISEFLNILIDAKKKDSSIYVGGAGRSGFVGKFFAMRLMHMGFKVSLLDEIIFKPMENDAVMILISKSAENDSIPSILKDSSKSNIRGLSICGGKSTDFYKHLKPSIAIEELTNKKYSKEEKEQLNKYDFSKDDLLVMGTSFEISALVILDTLIVELMNELEISSEDMQKNHDVLASIGD